MALLLSGCAGLQQDVALTPSPLPTATVQARGETIPVGTRNADAADDPAIWRNAANPAASLIVGTDKKAGLYVYGLDGKVRHFIDAGRVNNVDLLTRRTASGREEVIVVASDRNDVANARLALFRLDTASGALIAIGKVDGGRGEAYGICLYQPPVVGAGGAQFYAYSVLKEGLIVQVAFDAALNGRIVRTMRVPTQPEGCVVDWRSNALYVGEEDVGIWRFDAAPTAPVEGRIVARADGKEMVMDVEGLAYLPGMGMGGYLIASSQGDNAYAVYSTPDHRYLGRFRITAGPLGAAEETDGIGAMLGDFGPNYPSGLFVAQDGVNGAAAQNFKLIAWADIVTALGLPQ